MHHLYYITERISRSSLDVDVGPLNIKSDNLIMNQHLYHSWPINLDHRIVTLIVIIDP